MAGFCRNCGTALGDGQAFCVKCGTRVADTSQPSAGASGAAPAAPAAYAPPAPVPPPAASGGGPLVKILIGVVIVFVVFGALAAGAVLYIGHRVHQKARELGLTRSDEEMRASRAELRRIDGCALLSKAEVREAVKMDIVRVEAQTGDAPGCTYSVNGDAGDLTMKHLSAMHKNEMNKSEQDTMENFGKTILHGAAAPGGNSADRPGEAPVFAFSIDANAAQLQMRLNKATLGNMGPAAITPSVPNLGDEAFDAAGAMLFVRKGDKIVRIMYMSCPCGLEDILPLARKIVDAL